MRDAAMTMALIVLGLALGGGVVALGALHWRGVVRFGRRPPAWGLGTLLFGLLQVGCWLIFPGPPEVWLRLVIALVAAVGVGGWLVWRRGARMA
jgi:hypothetical protein